MLFQYNAYGYFLEEDISNSLGFIQDIVEQKISDRNYLQYTIMNSLNMIAGGEFINFKDTFAKRKTYVNKEEIKRIKNKQAKILDKLL